MRPRRDTHHAGQVGSVLRGGAELRVLHGMRRRNGDADGRLDLCLVSYARRERAGQAWPSLITDPCSVPPPSQSATPWPSTKASPLPPRAGPSSAACSLASMPPTRTGRLWWGLPQHRRRSRAQVLVAPGQRPRTLPRRRLRLAPPIHYRRTPRPRKPVLRLQKQTLHRKLGSPGP
jgi:hypothetical protein